MPRTYALDWVCVASFGSRGGEEVASQSRLQLPHGRQEPAPALAVVSVK